MIVLIRSFGSVSFGTSPRLLASETGGCDGCFRVSVCCLCDKLGVAGM